MSMKALENQNRTGGCYLAVSLFALLIAVLCISFGVPLDAQAEDNSVVVGGVYVTPNPSGKFAVSKILVADNEAVHVRFYKEELPEIPKSIATKDLHVAIGHAPLSRKGWLKEQRTFLAKENVSEQELEGYKLYLGE